jgi:hypothetical protein
MSQDFSTPDSIWILTEETIASDTETFLESTSPNGSRSSQDIGGRLGPDTTEEIILTKKQDQVIITRRKVEVTHLKEEMKGFLQAMREVLDEAETPDSKLQLQEVELSVEINGEGKISLLGFGGKAGAKGAMTFKFQRQ